jgi:DNA-binding LacI/PurR family transcriptional regulator
MGRCASLRQVAQAAGVSESRASIVLNERYDIAVSSETRRKVKAAAKRLEYRPNPIARALRTRKSGMIGLIIPNATIPFYNEIIQGIAIAAARKSYSLVLACTEFEPRSELQYLADMERRGIEGIILVALERSNAAAVQAVARRLPIVFVDSYLADTDISYVVTDNRQGARLATEYLLERGCRRIAFMGSRRVPVLEERFQGFLETLAAHGVAFNPRLDLQRRGSDTVRVPRAEPFDGIFASTLHSVMDALQPLWRMGKQVPRDVVIAGFDRPYFPADSAEALQAMSIVHEPLPHVEQPRLEMGRRVAELLFERLADPAAAPIRQMLAPSFRESPTGNGGAR